MKEAGGKGHRHLEDDPVSWGRREGRGWPRPCCKTQQCQKGSCCRLMWWHSQLFPTSCPGHTDTMVLSGPPRPHGLSLSQGTIFILGAVSLARNHRRDVHCGFRGPQDPSDCCFPQVSGSFPRQSTGQKVGLPQCFSYQAKDKSCHTQA